MSVVFGQIRLAHYLDRVQGQVRGNIVTDAKYRSYAADYQIEKLSNGKIAIQRANGNGARVVLPTEIPLTPDIVSFFGLYSGDGAKGSEDRADPSKIRPAISFSQREPNLVKFAVDCFRHLFTSNIHLTFSLGEDSAYFMDGDGYEALLRHYGGTLPNAHPLSRVRPRPNAADNRYLSETRAQPKSNEEYLAFYYQHKDAMQEILSAVKAQELETSGVTLTESDRVTASLRRPFKKGARHPGGSSRSDEIHVGGLTGLGELFLKILHEIEDSIHRDVGESSQSLILWSEAPSSCGEELTVSDFFSTHPYGTIANERPSIVDTGALLKGKWPRSKLISLQKRFRIDPLFCYVSGLYLAEGSTPKKELFAMYVRRPKSLSFGFTTSEDTSLNLVLRALKRLFKESDCMTFWKVKVGSQYFPELVVIGLKSAVPMLRGGNSGDGKLRTIEISLALKPWALEVAPSLEPYADRFSHVEPTGAGLARVDFSASSVLCRWLFPLMIYATFGELITDPAGEFTNE